MNPAQLLQHFDRISDAPHAIPRLRRFILDLAVRGKLVEQNRNDEPASELLKRIQTEKKRLIKEGKIRNPRALEARDQDDELFPLPSLWVWCLLSEVGAIVGGGTPPSANDDNFTTAGCGIAWLTPADLGKHTGLYVSHGARDLTPQGLHSSSATLMPKGSVLFTSRAPIGYTAIGANEVSTNQGFKSVVPIIPECNLYIAVYFRAFGKWIDGEASGTTFREVSGKVVAALPFPLPPIAEQHRIVAKVDELMALCDRLEAAQAERENRRARLVAASLQRLNEPVDAAAFREDADFHLRHLARLTTHPDQIQPLRQTILNLAVRGQLVLHDPSEGLASELVNQIQAEQEKLRRARVLKRVDRDWRLLEDEIPFEIPPTWRWAALGSLIVFGPQNGISPKPASRPDAPKAITLTATTKGIFDPRYFKLVEATIPSDSEFWLRPGDLLFQRGNTREYVGIAAYYTGEPALFLYPDLMIKVRLSEKVSLPYVHLCAVAPYARTYLSTHAAGAQATMPKINQETLVQLPIPLPSLSEQHRIVAKVEGLMALCDRLEAQLTTAQTESRRLLEAVLHEAVAPAG
jgi:type I restriction enzyme S subunit